MEVIWTGAARADLTRIFAFNVERNIDWALRVDERIQERGEALALLPRAGRPLRGSNLRALSIPDVQYVITYRADDAKVIILRVESTREIT